jgi:hypothetical protein
MSQQLWIEIVIAVPVIMTQVAIIVQSVIAGRKANRKLDHIVILTNSTLSTALKRIAHLEEELEKTAGEQRRE